ncbi:dienelactone hydrolase family protein [Pseudonocardia sp. ICBG1122]|nr:dienelactone hydrolase family protein [Pseudonocardia pini]
MAVDPVTTTWETVSSPDTPISVFVARATSPTDCLVVVPENPGITAWRQEETARMAADLGWTVVVMSPYSRIGGGPPAGPFATADERRRAAFLAMPDEQVAGDLAATVAWVRERGWTAGGGAPAVLGFCSGGGQVVHAVSTRHGLARAAVSIYGNIVLRGEFTPDREPIDRSGSGALIDCPFQMHVGGLDSEIPEAYVAAFEAELARSGQPFAVYRYDDADHIFTDATHPNFDPEATQLVWRRVYAFLTAGTV